MSIERSFEQFPELETKNLLLKEITQNNEVEIFNIFSDTDVMKYYDINPLEKASEASNLIIFLSKRYENKNGIRWGIYTKRENRLIGTCGFHNISKQASRVELGYELCKEYWNQGIMKEALDAIVLYGFRDMKFNRIQALVEPENKASIKLLLKLKFSEEGTMKEYEFYKGKYVDLSMFSLLRKDY